MFSVELRWLLRKKYKKFKKYLSSLSYCNFGKKNYTNPNIANVQFLTDFFYIS